MGYLLHRIIDSFPRLVCLKTGFKPVADMERINIVCELKMIPSVGIRSD